MPAEVKANGLEFNTSIDVVESLGSEKFVYFTRELGQTHNVAELEELARDSGRADAGGAAAETVVARLDPASRIREGEDARLWVDMRKLHVFDPSTGRNLSLGAADRGRSGWCARGGRHRRGGRDGRGRGSGPGRPGSHDGRPGQRGGLPVARRRQLIPAVRACLATA